MKHKIITKSWNSRKTDTIFQSDELLEQFLNEKAESGLELINIIVLNDSTSARQIKFIFKGKDK